MTLYSQSRSGKQRGSNRANRNTGRLRRHDIVDCGLRDGADGRVEAHDLRRDGSNGAICDGRGTLGDGVDVGRVHCRRSVSGSRLGWGNAGALSGCYQGRCRDKRGSENAAGLRSGDGVTFGFGDGADGGVEADDVGGDGSDGAVCHGCGALGDRVDVGRVHGGGGVDGCSLG